jgi:hypothetical protein
MTLTAAAPPVARCQFCRARLSRHGQQAACCRACRRRHRCPICEGFKAESGRTWCPACKAGYRLASRLLLSFGQVSRLRRNGVPGPVAGGRRLSHLITTHGGVST